MKYKLVIFDLDGTLADSFHCFLSIVNTLADTHKFKHIEQHEVETLRGVGARQLVRHLGVAWWKMPAISRDMRRLAAEHYDQLAVFDGVDQVLEQLTEAGVQIGLVTSNSYANTCRVLGPTNVARITYVECDVSIFGKAGPFRRILKRSGVPPDKTLCIGDELRDLEAAGRAKLHFGAVAWGFTRIDALTAHAPSEVFMTVDELMRLGPSSKT